MKQGRFSDEQITGILSEMRAGVPVKDLCRKHNISDKTIYNWRKKFGGMQGVEVRRLKDLEQTVARLERIVAKQALELQAAQEIIRGKW